MRTTIAICLVCFASLLAACDVTLTQVLPATELARSERSAFTSDGRFFVIGSRAEGRSDAGDWIVEITKAPDASYVTTNYVSGTLEGTDGGVLGGVPRGQPCLFSGMTVRGLSLYAACVSLDGVRAALIEVDTQARTVRAGYFTTCNAEPSSAPCQDIQFYPNGMAVDAAGRVYLSNTAAHLSTTGDLPAITVDGARTLTQVTLGAPDAPGVLSFTHRDWFSTDIFSDGLAPNGVQIEGSTLYYAAGANINRIEIRADGSPGAAGVHYAGPFLTMIDDFVVHDGRMALARALPPELAALERAAPFGTARQVATEPMALDSVPSSISYQADVPAGAPLFPAESLIITSYFGGGLYVLSGVSR